LPEQPSKLQIVERRHGDVVVLVLTGQMLLDDGDLAFRAKIHELVDRGDVKIVVDLAAVNYIDSSGIGMLVAKVKTVRERHGDIKLARLTSRTQTLLASLRLALVFETLEDEAAAVRAFSWSRKPVR
jgi:anti-sigma B factor antagonist